MKYFFNGKPILKYTNLINKSTIMKNLRKIKTSLSSLSVIALLLLGIGITVALTKFTQDTRSGASSSSVDLSYVPSMSNINPGDTVVVDIFMNTQIHSVTSIQLELNFDSNLFDFVSLEPGNTLNEVIVSGAAFGDRAFLTLGTKPVLVDPGPPAKYEISPFKGTGILAKLTLKAKAGLEYNESVITTVRDRGDGTGTIALTKDLGSNNVIGDLDPGYITIGTIPSSPTPTPTPTSASSPTPDPTSASSPSPIPTPTSTPLPQQNDEVSIISAKVTRVFLNRVQIEVEATSSGAPDATLTVVNYGDMRFSRKSNTYSVKFWAENPPPTQLSVVSSLGGMADAVVDISKMNN